MTVPLRGPHLSVKIRARCEDLGSLCAAKTTPSTSLKVPPVQQIRPMTPAGWMHTRHPERFFFLPGSTTDGSAPPHPPTRHFCLSGFLLQVRASQRPPQRASSSAAVLSGRSEASPTPVRLNYIRIARPQTNLDGCTLEKRHVIWFIYLSIFLSIWDLDSTNDLSAKERRPSRVPQLPASDFPHEGSEIFYPDVPFFMEKKKESVWPLCGASSFVGCLSACSRWKGTFSLTELERKASAYSQPRSLLAKFLSAIWQISHMAQLQSCDPDGELKISGGRAGGLEGQEAKNGGWNGGKWVSQGLRWTWTR